MSLHAPTAAEAPELISRCETVILELATSGADLDAIRDWVTHRALARDAVPTQAETDAVNSAHRERHASQPLAWTTAA